MKRNMFTKMVVAVVVGAVTLVGTSVPSSAQQTRGKKQKVQVEGTAPKKVQVERTAPKRVQVERTAPKQVVVQQRQPRVVLTDQQQQDARQRSSAVQQQQRAAQQRELQRQQQQRVTVQQQDQRRVERQRQTQIDQQQVIDRQQQRAGQRRLDQQQQRQVVLQQQQRIARYQQRLNQDQRLADQRIARLREQKRMAQWQYQQEYFRRIAEQQRQLQAYQNYNYYNDPYFYTAPSYRYNRGGSWYQTNSYGADLLRQAVNYGYQEGFRAGQADRSDRWGYNYRDSFAFQDANFGYNGLYLDQDAYNYYFRQGFERGYEDGYYSRNRYGSYNNGALSILGAVVNTILNLQSLD